MVKKKTLVQIGILAGAFILGTVYAKRDLNKDPNDCLDKGLPCTSGYYNR